MPNAISFRLWAASSSALLEEVDVCWVAEEKEFAVHRYLALFKAGGSGPEQMGEPSADQHAAWLLWKDKAGDAIVDFGAPTIAVPGGSGGVGGYSIVQADTADALDAIFATNPHRQQGGTIEFYQIVEIPGG